MGDLEAKLEDNNQLVTEWKRSRTNDNNQIKFMKRKINELMSQLEVARNIKKYHAEQNEKEIERQRDFSEKFESELNDTKTKFNTVNDELERKLIHSKSENKKQAELITTLHLETDK